MKDLLREEYAKIWGGRDERMTDYCVNKVATIAVLPDGAIIPVEKQGIKKHFCFGESGYDFDEAQERAHIARTNAEYFKAKNMEYFRTWLKDLRGALSGDTDYMLVIYTHVYTGQPEDCKIASAHWVRLGDIIEACGGSAYLHELAGREIVYRGQACRIATNEELQLILDAYTDAGKKHEKKVDAYLKRYGMTKVEAWTYWRDA